MLMTRLPWLGFVAVLVALSTGTATGQGPASTVAQTRPFKLGFTPFPPTPDDYGYQIAYTFMHDNGDVVSLSFQDGVPWVEALASSDYHTYSQNLQDSFAAVSARSANYIPNQSLYLSMNLINLDFMGLAPYWGNGPNLQLPVPWNQYNFDHPYVKQAALNYAIALITYFKPQYFATSVEANILLARNVGAWGPYKTLQAYLYQELKRRFPTLLVFTTIQYEHMLGKLSWSADLARQFAPFYPNVLEGEVRELMKNSDVFALSTYPYSAAFNVVDATYYDRAVKIASDMNKPLAIEQTGYISQDIDVYTTILPGSEQLQQQFFSYVFSTASTNRFLFIINFVPMDYGYNYGTSVLSMAWSWTGLSYTDGTPKAVLGDWDNWLSAPYVAPPTDRFGGGPQ
jgi:hypothetical protein